MVNRPSVPEIITVNSESLQTQIRDLLPSQNGFGSELQASNVITPIIDLTAAAEGSTVGVDLQQALSFGSQTAFSVINTTTTLVNSTGFYRVFGTSMARAGSSGTASCRLTLDDGASTKDIYLHLVPAGISSSLIFDFIVFLAAGQLLSATTDTVNCNISGSTRQIATGSGTLVNPNGFPV
jgi:hypothetical protein